MDRMYVVTNVLSTELSDNLLLGLTASLAEELITTSVHANRHRGIFLSILKWEGRLVFGPDKFSHSDVRASH